MSKRQKLPIISSVNRIEVPDFFVWGVFVVTSLYSFRLLQSLAPITCTSLSHLRTVIWQPIGGKKNISITNPGAVLLPWASPGEVCPPLHFFAASGTFHILESPCKLNGSSWLRKSLLPSSFLNPSFPQSTAEFIFLACIWLLRVPSVIYLTGGFSFCHHLWFYSKHSTTLVYLEHISTANAA